MRRTAGRPGMRHLFDQWSQVARRLQAVERLALVLDFDGTLVPLQARPEDVWLDNRTRRVLRRLARHRRVSVWIISGRRRADLQKRVNVPGVRYLGVHGWEQSKGASWTGATKRLLRGARRRLADHLGELPHIWIEDKGLSFVVHYRGAAGATVRRARAVVRQVLQPLEPELRLLKGKKIWEVLPQEVEGKGAAVRARLAEFSGSALPIYIGDDTTDESAFAALRRGLTVLVGSSRRTRARFQLRNPEEVRIFLERLEAEIA